MKMEEKLTELEKRVDELSHQFQKLGAKTLYEDESYSYILKDNTIYLKNCIEKEYRTIERSKPDDVIWNLKHLILMMAAVDNK